MNSTRDASFKFAALAVLGLGGATGCEDRAARQQAVDRAQAQVRRIAADLDQRTTKSGAYVRATDDEVAEFDPWGTRIKIGYTQGGLAEVVSVRSAGPDREFMTDDDVHAAGLAANLKGVGEGVKENTEEVAAKAAQGFVKGAVSGVKDSLKDSWPKKKKDPSPLPASKPDAAQPAVEQES